MATENSKNLGNKEEEIQAAIAMALYEYAGYTTHDVESSKLTIKPKQTLWNMKSVMQRELPNKK